jgi:hypothetical protein
MGSTAMNAPQLLTEDGGVSKVTLSNTSGRPVEDGDVLAVAYRARVASTGKVFADGEKFEFTVKDGSMIKGWDIAITSMRVGEKAEFTIAPQYAYGYAGVEPMIPSDATIAIDMEVLAFLGNVQKPETLFDLDPFVPRSTKAIQEQYNKRMAAKPIPREGLQGFVDWAKNIYIFGFFTSQTGEKAPWYLDPNITFPSLFAIVGIAFYILLASGGITTNRDLSVADDVDANTLAPIQQIETQRTQQPSIRSMFQ